MSSQRAHSNGQLVENRPRSFIEKAEADGAKSPTFDSPAPRAFVRNTDFQVDPKIR